MSSNTVECNGIQCSNVQHRPLYMAYYCDITMIISGNILNSDICVEVMSCLGKRCVMAWYICISILHEFYNDEESAYWLPPLSEYTRYLIICPDNSPISNNVLFLLVLEISVVDKFDGLGVCFSNNEDDWLTLIRVGFSINAMSVTYWLNTVSPVTTREIEGLATHTCVTREIRADFWDTYMRDSAKLS